MTTAQRALLIVGVLMACWLLEAGFPLFKFSYKKLRHDGVNLIFLATTLVINIVFALATVGIFLWTAQQQFGLIYWIDMPIWLSLLVTILVFEFIAQYLAHYLLHRVSWMWKFHMIHHSDTHVDATTGTRHHPGDFAIREIFALGAVLITGAPIGYYFLYRSLSVVFTYFTHANIHLPIWLDKPLSYIFVTPNMHKFHHHFERPWTDTNFGNIFSIWDRMFGTFVYGDPAEVKYGLDVLDGEKDEEVGYLFKIPFDKRIKTDY